MSNDFLWCEKYRPQTILETILPTRLKDTFSEMVRAGELQNMLFTGTAGVGKTTVAKALCKELGLDYIVINGSEDGNIDTLRGKIRQFASTVSFSGGKKVVILDEADYLNAQSTQPALRGFIEQFSDNCRFILTCNFKNRIIEPLHSRCGVYDFTPSKKELPELASQIMTRLVEILKGEGVEVTSEHDLAKLIMKFTPDWRRVINEAQRHSVGGKLVLSSSESISAQQFDELFLSLKAKDFKKVRSWVVNNMDLEPASIYRGLYNNMYEKVQASSIPQLVLILADYQYKQAFVADSEINIMSCMTEIMGDIVFK